MANHEHLEILKQGVNVWNKWMKENIGFKVDLSRANLKGINLNEANLYGAKLSGAILVEADLSWANLSGANLSGANLSRANLDEADLSGANLSGANLHGADLHAANLHGADLHAAILHGAKLSGANLKEADLSWANLYGTNLYRADLTETDLHQAFIGQTIFACIDLRVVNGLDTVTHEGPSAIDIDTLYKSQGQISDVFLRGCGVPDEMIEYVKSLTNSPIQFYSCFISYSKNDDEFAQRLYVDLQAKGVRCWFAPHDMRGGREVHHQIDEAIRDYEKLLLILSEDSMSSNWVGTEIIKTKKKEDKQGKQMLFPIGIVPFDNVKEWEFFDSDSGRDLAKEIRKYYIPDFSTWKTDHDSYQRAFVRLLRDLQPG